MKTHSNWKNNTNSLSAIFYTKEETIESVQSNFDYRRFYSAEGKVVSIDGVSEQVIIQDHSNPLNADKTDKKIHIPNTSFAKMGSVVSFSNSNWLIISDIKDVDGAYKSAQILESNYNLKFQLTDGTIKTIPIIYTQNTASLDQGNMITTVKQIITIKAQFDSDYNDILTTNKRLMIDSRLPSISNPNCYKITEATFNTYDGTNGVLNITCGKDEYDPTSDRKDFGICDYQTVVHSVGSAEITYVDDCNITVGYSNTFTASFKDEHGSSVDINPIWNCSSSSGSMNGISVTPNDTNKTVIITSIYDESLVNNILTLILTEESGIYGATSIQIKIKPLL